MLPEKKHVFCKSPKSIPPGIDGEERIEGFNLPFLPISEILLGTLVHLHIKCARPICAPPPLVTLETMPSLRDCMRPAANLQPVASHREGRSWGKVGFFQDVFSG